MAAKPKSICLALIHNNNEKRNRHVVPKLRQLAEFLSNDHDVEVIDVFSQPDPEIVHLRHLARREIDFQRLQYRCRDYGGRLAGRLSFAMRIARLLLRRHLFASRRKRKAQRRMTAIETLVTDKHIRAWDRFLDHGSDILICFEDDTVFEDDSIEKAREAIVFAENEFRDSAFFADLAGGYPLARLGADKFVTSSHGRIKVLAKPFTNTACCYMLNRACVWDFKTKLIEDPVQRSLPCDWMINNLLLDLKAAGRSPRCFHTDPPVFKHGSFTGDYGAWRNESDSEAPTNSASSCA